MKNKNPLFLAVLPVFFIGFVLGPMVQPGDDESFVYDAGVMSYNFEVIVKGPDGEIKSYERNHNLVVGEGLETEHDLKFVGTNHNGNATDTKFSYILIGDGDTAATVYDYDLETPISGCAAIQDATPSIGGTNTSRWTYFSVTFSGANCESTTISEAVFKNDATGGETYARNTFTNTNVGPADSITINWNFSSTDDGV